jgi:hypothetical protein
MKFKDWPEEEQKEFLEPDSAYEYSLREKLLEYGYTTDWSRWKLLQNHSWKELPHQQRIALNLDVKKGWYKCQHCGNLAYGPGPFGFPSYFEEEPDLCLTDDEKFVKDIIE